MFSERMAFARCAKFIIDDDVEFTSERIDLNESSDLPGWKNHLMVN